MVLLITKEILEEKYIRQKKTMMQIAKDLGFKHESSVDALLKRHGIPKRTKEEVRELTVFAKGENNPRWKGGISKGRSKIYNNSAWSKAVRVVKKRDKGCCRLCLSKEIFTKGQEIHHIDRFALAPLLVFDPGNWILLCTPCHKKITRHESRWKRRLFTLIDQPLTMQPFGAT